MADRPPRDVALRIRRARRSRPAQAAHGRGGHIFLERKIRAAETARHLQRQMAIGAKRGDAQLLQSGAIGRGSRVDE